MYTDSFAMARPRMVEEEQEKGTRNFKVLLCVGIDKAINNSSWQRSTSRNRRGTSNQLAQLVLIVAC